jgi:hypothetical protein
MLGGEKTLLDINILHDTKLVKSYSHKSYS